MVAELNCNTINLHHSVFLHLLFTCHFSSLALTHGPYTWRSSTLPQGFSYTWSLHMPVKHPSTGFFLHMVLTHDGQAPFHRVFLTHGPYTWRSSTLGQGFSYTWLLHMTSVHYFPTWKLNGGKNWSTSITRVTSVWQVCYVLDLLFYQVRCHHMGSTLVWRIIP
jgi:hypothetical protein